MIPAFIAMGVGFIGCVVGLILAGTSRRTGRAVAVALVGLAVSLGGMFRAAIVQQDECHAKGGHMVGDGHMVPIVVTSGKTTSIIMHEQRGCVVIP